MMLLWTREIFDCGFNYISLRLHIFATVFLTLTIREQLLDSLKSILKCHCSTTSICPIIPGFFLYPTIPKIIPA